MSLLAYLNVSDNPIYCLTLLPIKLSIILKYVSRLRFILVFFLWSRPGTLKLFQWIFLFLSLFNFSPLGLLCISNNFFPSHHTFTFISYAIYSLDSFLLPNLIKLFLFRFPFFRFLLSVPLRLLLFCFLYALVQYFFPSSLLIFFISSLATMKECNPRRRIISDGDRSRKEFLLPQHPDSNK